MYEYSWFPFFRFLTRKHKKKRVKEPYCMFLDFDQNCFLYLFVIQFTEPNSPKVPSSEKSGVPLSSGSETVADS